MLRIDNFINGAWHPARLTAQDRSPVNNAPLVEYPLSEAADIDRAVTAASAAGSDWASRTPTQRSAFLAAIADGVCQRREQIANAISQSVGKPITEAFMDVDDAIDCYRYYADLIKQTPREQAISTGVEELDSLLCRDPVGVVGLITPWNFPTVTTAWKLAPALAAGCTVVLKPSEVSPWPEAMLADIVNEAGLPAGVVNIVHGNGDAGAALVNHPAVRKISFTGSTGTGKRIAHACAEDIKNLSLELGGKSSIIVCADADPALAVQTIIGGIFFNNGQICSATSRLLIHESLAPTLLPQLKAATEALVIGDPTNNSCELGPLASQAQFDKVMAYLALATEENLDCLTGGHALPERGHCYVAPTIYKNVPAESQLWNDEIFGPVLCIQTFADNDEAIAIANDSEFGLAASVVSQDIAEAQRIARALEAGNIWINTDQRVLVATSWGGMKHSGLGRELGPWGLAAFTEIKHIHTPSAE